MFLLPRKPLPLASVAKAKLDKLCSEDVAAAEALSELSRRVEIA